MSLRLKQAGYGLSALALIAGSGIFAPRVYADTLAECTAELEATACQASTLEALLAGTGNARVEGVYLAGDITGVTSTIEINRSMTLNLDGNTLSATGVPIIRVLENGDLNISSDKSDGLVETKNGASNEAAIEVKEGILEINSDVKVSSEKGYGIFAMNGGSVDVVGGYVSAYSAALTGNNTTGDMNFYVYNGAYLESTNNVPAVYMPGQADLIIIDATLRGGIVARMGQIDIINSFITSATNIDELDAICTGTTRCYEYSGFSWMPGIINILGGSYTSNNEDYGNSLNLNMIGGHHEVINDSDRGHAIMIYDQGKVEQEININIYGGEFQTNGSSVIGEYTLSDFTGTDPAVSNQANVRIMGGTYSEIPSEEYLADGYKVYDFGDDTEDRFTVLGEIEVDEADDSKTETEEDAWILEDTAANLISKFLASYASGDVTLDDEYYYDENGNSISVNSLVDMLARREQVEVSYGEYVFSDEEVEEMKAGLELIAEAAPELYAELMAELGENSTIIGAFRAEVGMNGVGNIIKLDNEITQSYAVPEDYLTAPEGYKRTFFVVRQHVIMGDGSNTISYKRLDATLDGATLTFKNDLFSDFFIAYEDTAIEEESESEEAETNPNTLDRGGLIFAITAGTSVPLVLWGAYLATKRN
ncbi:hypothetical protein IJJ46_01930 [Candidatus Saccharibacteria bacterium]|nr:hypothetical protein [Candidatus Saccharibacteria bacterium]